MGTPALAMGSHCNLNIYIRPECPTYMRASTSIP